MTEETKRNPLAMTDEEKRVAYDRLEKATYDLLDEQPFVGHLVQKLSRTVSKEIPTACVSVVDNKYSLMVNPQFFCSQGRKESQAILKHEVYHLLNEHLKRMADKDRMVWNVAADMAINQYIPFLPRFDREEMKQKLMNKLELSEEEAEKQLPKADANGKCCTGMLPQHYDLPLEKTSEWYYNKIMSDPKLRQKFQQPSLTVGDINSMSDEEREKLKQDIKNGNVRLEVGSGEHKKWESVEGETKEILDTELKNIIQEAMAAAGKDYGNLPMSMQRAIKAFLTTEVNWKAELRKFIQFATEVKIKTSRKRPSRRYGVAFAGNKPDLKLKLGVIVDTSGSISPEELQLFAGEINRIYDTGGARIIVIEGDAEVQAVYPLKKKFKPEMKRFYGGGGTNASPWIKEAEKQNVDAAVVLTDGYFYGEKIKKPKLGILWALTESGYKVEDFKKQVSFGKMLKLKTQKGRHGDV